MGLTDDLYSSVMWPHWWIYGTQGWQVQHEPTNIGGIWKPCGFFSPFTFGRHHFTFWMLPPRIRPPPTHHHRRLPTIIAARPRRLRPGYHGHYTGRLWPPRLLRCHGATATALATSARATTMRALEPDTARAAELPPSPLVPHGPLFPPLSQPPPELPAPPCVPLSQTSWGPLSRTPVHRHHPLAAARCPTAAHRMLGAPPMLTGCRPAIRSYQPSSCTLLPTGESKRFEIW
jgi:hypothetical protein